MRENDAGDGRRQRWSRRAVLATGTSGLVASGAGALAADDLLPSNVHLSDLLGSTTRPGAGINRFERVYSFARGKEVTLRLLLPSKDPPPGTPVCLLLHGLHGHANAVGMPSLADRLVRLVGSGALAPFAFAAVDGGDHYWHDNHRGDNPMAMLLDELPLWLLTRGLGGLSGRPFACAGVSMGGFGAMLYGRRRRERAGSLRSVATVAPALITTWHEMSKRNAFRDATEWAELDPLRHPHALRGTPTGIWCGDRDRFITGVRRYAAAADPEVTEIRPGRHTWTFFDSVVPDLLRFVGKYVPTTG